MADEKQDRPCSNCGRLESEHVAAVDAVGLPVRVCPKAVFRAMGEKEVAPRVNDADFRHTRAQSSVP